MSLDHDLQRDQARDWVKTSTSAVAKLLRARGGSLTYFPARPLPAAYLRDLEPRARPLQVAADLAASHGARVAMGAAFLTYGEVVGHVWAYTEAGVVDPLMPAAAFYLGAALTLDELRTLGVERIVTTTPTDVRDVA